ncbi:MAG: hypothetical protein QXS93_00530 [Candidatus Micrarchaeia archaeon]
MSQEYSEINRNSVVCDSSSLISLAESCQLDVLSFLKQHMYGDFIYPRTVRIESMERPLGMREHALRAFRLMDYEKSGAIKFVDYDVSRKMREIMDIANSIFSVAGRPIQLVDDGEAAQVALAIEFGINTILIDERTTRTLIEAPFRHKEHLEREFRKPVRMNDALMDEFNSLTRGLKIIRSSEIILLAYKYGYFDHYGELKSKALEGALYGVKLCGCSISFEEIDEIMRELNARQLF